MKKSLLFLLISLPFFLAAQNYQNICSPGITFFKDKDSYLKAFRRDSVQLPGNNDSIFYSYTTIRSSSLDNMTCKDTTNGDALGRKIYKKADGRVLFFNKINDTIALNTMASLNESWKYCNLSGNGYLEAKVTEIITDSVLGLTDQVKVILFQAKNSAGTNITNIFNQKHIKLSQHYGLSEIYDIYWTPDDTVHYILAGKTTPALGIQPFTWKDVYNFDVGDEFHYYDYYHYNSQGPYWNSIKKILAKTVYGNNDSVVYKIEFCQKEWFPGPSTGIQVTYDTIFETYNFTALSNDLTIQRLPDEFVSRVEGQLYDIPQYSRQISFSNNRSVQIYDGIAYWFYPDTHCYNYPFEGGENTHYYSPGLGQTGFTYTEGPDPMIDNREYLVYYKKGSETWGTPVATDCNALVPVPSMTAAQKTVVRIIPNPIETNGTIIVENYFPGDPLQLIIYDFVGRKVAEIIIKSASTELPNENLSSGLYFFTLSGRSGSIIEKGKIVLR